MDFMDSETLSPTLVLNDTYCLNKIVNCYFTFKYTEEDIKLRTIINLPNKSGCWYDGFSTKPHKNQPALTKLSSF